jgi:predicted ATP-dependent protease
LTGQQGVLIPQANAHNLMLRSDVVEAMHQERFHVYPITHVDQGLELLKGVPAGDLMTAGTVHYLVNAQLRHFATAMIAFSPDARNGTRPQPREGRASD